MSLPGMDLEALRRWFPAHLAAGPELRARLIAGGRSNLTYEVMDGEKRWIVRRPPVGTLVKTAHDVGREYRVLSALKNSDVPVPLTYALCDDTDVLGAPFYVMEKVFGRILRSLDDLRTVNRHDARATSWDLIDVLAQLHQVDPSAVGLADLGHPDGFLERNVARWGDQWVANKTREVPRLEELARRVRSAVPRSGPPGIVHGDYRIENTVLAFDRPEVVAVLDWEMSTLGDPLTDLGYFIVYWDAWDSEHRHPALATGGVADLPGFVDRNRLLDRYADSTGRDLSDLDFYIVFAFYKLAVILEGVNARYLRAQTVGEGFDQMEARVESVLDIAFEAAARSDVAALRG